MGGGGGGVLFWFFLEGRCARIVSLSKPKNTNKQGREAREGGGGRIRAGFELEWVGRGGEW
jgi:hypothetical protein